MTSSPDESPAGLPHPNLARRRILELLPEAMHARGVDLFIVFTRENARDPFSDEVGLARAVARTAGLFHLDTAGVLHRSAIAASYDTTPIEESGLYEQVIPYREEGIKPHLSKAVTHTAPRRIAVNTSRDLTIADGLTSGMRDYLELALGQDLSARMVSSEAIILSILGRKFPEEIALLERAAIETQEILARCLSSEIVRPGVTTERALGDAIEADTRSRGLGVAFTTVVVGPTRGHSSPTDRVIQRGDLIRIDYGVVNQGYCSDIQRTAYVLAEGETEAPAEIRKMFDVTLASHEAAIATMRPGANGLAADSAARRVIEQAGYRGYPHAAGHGLGRKVHDVGPMLGPDWPERYGSLVRATLEPGQVFAVEPMVYAEVPGQPGELHIGLEEDVVIEASGARIFGNPQRSLILIR
jgi:Xaa-Pro dipeptidase